MTQEYVPTDSEILEDYLPDEEAIGFDARTMSFGTWKKLRKEAFDRWLAAHDAQIRAEALELTNEELDVAARAAFDSRDDAYDLEEWEDADSDDRERYQCYVRPAFSAVAKHRKEQK